MATIVSKMWRHSRVPLLNDWSNRFLVHLMVSAVTFVSKHCNLYCVGLVVMGNKTFRFFVLNVRFVM